MNIFNTFNLLNNSVEDKLINIYSQKDMDNQTIYCKLDKIAKRNIINKVFYIFYIIYLYFHHSKLQDM